MSYSNRLLWTHNFMMKPCKMIYFFQRQYIVNTGVITFFYSHSGTWRHLSLRSNFFSQVSKKKFTITDNSNIRNNCIKKVYLIATIHTLCRLALSLLQLMLCLWRHTYHSYILAEQHEQHLVKRWKLHKHFLVEPLQRSSHITAALPLKTTFFFSVVELLFGGKL